MTPAQNLETEDNCIIPTTTRILASQHIPMVNSFKKWYIMYTCAVSESNFDDQEIVPKVI